MPLAGEAAEHPTTVASGETVSDTVIQAAQVEGALETSGDPALPAWPGDVSSSWGGAEPDILQSTEVLEVQLPTNDGALADIKPRAAPDSVGSCRKRNAQSPLRSAAVSSSFTCDTCGKTFGRRTLRDNHIRTHSDDRAFACSFQGCDETFKQKNEQARHEKAQHAPKRFVCGGVNTSGQSWGCGKAFARRDGLHEHHTKTAKGADCLQASVGLL
ncbi:DNA-binding transcription factor [Elasticomyces elasticus]|nr:DNA-binding transcription factor [Elasticomyces elasticus]KAK3662969.1 DNA-binding transcription factor [Elasticomyces elasticus]KAK4918914.1 DNA-binding transcription factor [Elasticomyces elasticus]KAK5753798.1 DNA-binding transcription factor [Elasticomyces elasticus]